MSPMPELEMNYAMNWTFVLDLNRTVTVLNVEASGGISSIVLAQRVKTVYALAPDPETALSIRRLAQEQGVKNLTVLTDGTFPDIPLPARAVDLVVVHDVDRVIPAMVAGSRVQGRSAIAYFVEEAYRVLGPAGQLYLGASNRWGYPRWLGRLRHPGCVSRHAAGQLIQRAGFSTLRSFSYFPAIDRIEEVMGYGDDRSDGAVTVREWAKEMLRSERGLRWLAPAFGVVAGKGGSDQGIVDRLVADVTARSLVEAESPLGIRRYLGLQRKAVLLLGRPGSRAAELAVHLPLDEAAEARQQQEQRVLAALERSTAHMRHWVPVPLMEGRVGSQAYFVTSALPGISVDLPVRSMTTLLRAGSELLREFHRETMEVRTVDAALCRRLFLEPLDQLQAALEPDADGLDRIKSYVERAVTGRRLPLVWEHGDFYHENLLVDPKTFRITGVVDWAMARREGLPVTDLFCLLARGDALLQKAAVPTIVARTVMPQRFSEAQRDLLDGYLQEIPVPRELLPALGILFWANQIHRSGGVRRTPEWIARNVTAVVAEILTIAETSERALSHA